MTDEKPVHFIKQIIEDDIASGRWGEPGDRSIVRTRFPPEPNGFLHIGHAKAICLSFGLAAEYGGTCNLRFDDTNPTREEDAYVRSIIGDVKWLGFEWDGEVKYASDYFGQFHAWAVELIETGKAYVDDQTPEQIRATRGTPTAPGTNSPFRDRAIDENLDLFAKMKAGGFPDGSRVLRAKIDMKSPNFNLRDPVIYRILHARHHRTGADWSIYPMYDWAHGLEDSIEGITHSLCTLEFEIHRPLYDWFIDAINEGRSEPIHHPQQTEFARLNLTYTVLSKRRLLELVEGGQVTGWDDPRMPTISGYRRRGYTPEAIRSFVGEVGITKFDSVIDVGRLENACREHLNRAAPRRMCVLNPLRVTITNWGEGGDENRVEMMDAVNNPEDDSAGTRPVPFGRTLYIEREDFMEDPPRKFFRLGIGREVRLRYAYWVKCHDVVKDERGEVIELLCTYDPATRGGDSPPPDAQGKVRKVKGTLHWVSAAHALDVEVRLFDRLFSVESPARKPKDEGDDWDFKTNLNPGSLTVVQAKLEPNWRGESDPKWADGIERFQFERQGYFCVDCDSSDQSPVFNRTATLRDSWARATNKR
ncbi:MAG: glutamine--tRNA ligase/YqeY domain fusion protein [Planctomycetes bacterium]|nr:glutamine--tRNA ligase/YqeY domain fusion protein [Planctomycetota bacterium]